MDGWRDGWMERWMDEFLISFLLLLEPAGKRNVIVISDLLIISVKIENLLLL